MGFYCVNIVTASEVRNQLGILDEDSLIFSISFIIKEGVSGTKNLLRFLKIQEFSLGELSGGLKVLLNKAKKEINFSSFKSNFLLYKN